MSNTKQRRKVRQAENLEETSTLSATAEDSDGGSSKRKRHRRHDKDRQQDRGAQGADTTPRRSASQLGIKWIGDICPDGRPHYLVDKHTFAGGSLFKCINCLQHVWLPTYIKDATELEMLIKMYGAHTGYCKLLDKNRDAKVVVAKMQHLWDARQTMTNKEEFKRLVISVMKEKEYDRKETAK